MTGLTQLTGCKRPCHFKQYLQNHQNIPTLKTVSLQNLQNGPVCRFVGASIPTGRSGWQGSYVVAFEAVSKFTAVQTAMPVFPLASFVADFGEVLSLFLGCSFMTLWDGLQTTRRIARRKF